MSSPPSDSFIYLTGVDRAALAQALEEALRREGIPFHSGLQTTPVPQVVLSVPASRLEEARRAIEKETAIREESDIPYGPTPTAHPFDEDAPIEDDLDEILPIEPGAEKFPWAPVQVVLSLVLVHLAIVLLLVGTGPGVERLTQAGGLLRGRVLDEPWRLVTSLFVHVDPRHVFWNGVSMLVFAVPLILRLGYLRTGALYLVGGLAGSLAALASTTPGTVTVGSSGAVAGLFGAWVAQNLRRSRFQSLGRRERIRTIGIALLVLPSLVTPTTEAGQKISVAAHLGGLVAGLVLGSWMRKR